MPSFRLSLLAACILCSSLFQIAQAATDSDSLAQVIASRSDEERSRDSARHPAQTLAFFQLQPGMTVAEGLPGSGWYTRILADYLGGNGVLYGVNYADRMWPMFSFATDSPLNIRGASPARTAST